uniref:Uncharacterized protein n=1 Tax=viral metagenome TaxID=1070528 RepID=A0A6M3KFZ1_9ZZZZ
MTTVKQDQEFVKHLISEELLEIAIEWIADNLEPEDVFSEKALIEWAKSAGFIEDEE